MTERKAVMVRLTPEAHEALRVEAEKRGWTTGAVIEQALRKVGVLT